MWSRLRYRRRVEADLDRWQRSGWVTEAGAAAIRADLASAVGGGLAQSLSILAAVLIGFAVMSFVGANWQDMPRLARLTLLIGGLVASYIGAGALFSKGLDSFGHAAVLAGTALFGASIMLISQMYHMDGNPPDAVLVWAVGALAAGVLLRSNPALAAAMVLMGVWGWMSTALKGDVYWPFLIGWAAVAAAFFWQRWPAGVHIGGVPLTGFIISLGFLLNHGHAHPLVAFLGLAAVAAAVAGEKAWPELAHLWPGAMGYGMVAAFTGLMGLQFFEDPPLADFILWAVITLALLLLAIWWGLLSGHRGVLWLGYVGFSIEIIAIYAKKFGTLLDTSLFFLIAGLIVAALAVVAMKIGNRNPTTPALSPEASA